MALAAGSHVGRYRVVAAIGAGGMGEVYRARDAKLHRDVALKIVPDAFIADPDRLARFEREAQVLASLNHPNIAQIYGLEDQGTSRAIVMELVEGRTLAEVLASTPGGLPLDDAIALARQMAEALETAHDRGVIHRDFKPGNVMLTGDERVKVLDFGLARAAETASDLDAANSPTVAAPGATRAGIILGTAAYMSPEQAKGRITDKRTDVWSFGCVLYEMVTGVPVFAGENVADTLAAVLTREPDWSRLPPATPRALRLCLERCLVRDRHQRIGDMSTVRFLLSDIIRFDAGAIAEPSKPRGRRVAMLWAGTTVLAAAAAGAAAWFARPAPAGSGVITRFEFAVPEAAALANGNRQAAVSSDGTRVVFAAGRQLYLRELAGTQAHPIVGADDNPMYPVFSPDGRSVAYVTPVGAMVRRIAVTGGAPETIAELPSGTSDMSWQNGVIVLALNTVAAGIYTVPDRGGTLRKVVTTDPAVEEVSQPELVGDSHVLFTLRRLELPAALGGNSLVIHSLDGNSRKTVMPNATSGHVLASGQLAFISGGNIRAVAFDPRRLETRGESVLIAGSVGAAFSVSGNGTLVHGAAGPTTLRSVVWVDRQGRERTITPTPGPYFDVRISPDGTRIAWSAAGDLWIWTIANDTLTKLTLTTEAVEYNPVWTADSQFVIFDSSDGTARRIMKKAADGTGPTLELANVAGYPEAVSPDGRFLVYHTQNNVGILRPLDPAGEGRTLVAGRVGGRVQAFNADLSPNGQWIAYQSDESGSREVYVRPFPALEPGGWQVSTGGGAHPLWARDGRELFYIDRAGMLVAVPVHTEGRFAFEKGTTLFQAGQYYVNVARDYDVSTDGRRFVFVKTMTEGVTRPSFTIVTNWFDEVREKLGQK